MNVLKYRVSLDMFDVSSQTTIKAKKCDSACQIHITLTENGKIYHISEGSHATFNAKKSDGNLVYDNCTIENNTIVYDFSSSIDEDGIPQISAREGIVECEVTLYNDKNEQLTSPRFTLYIDGTVYNGEEIVSTPQANALKELINEANKTVEEIETKLENGELNGEDGFSPTVKITDIANGHKFAITDKDGTKSFDVLNGDDGKTPYINDNDNWQIGETDTGVRARVDSNRNTLKKIHTSTNNSWSVNDMSSKEHELIIRVKPRNLSTETLLNVGVDVSRYTMGEFGIGFESFVTEPCYDKKAIFLRILYTGQTDLDGILISAFGIIAQSPNGVEKLIAETATYYTEDQSSPYYWGRHILTDCSNMTNDTRIRLNKWQNELIARFEIDSDTTNFVPYLNISELFGTTPDSRTITIQAATSAHDNSWLEVVPSFQYGVAERGEIYKPPEMFPWTEYNTTNMQTVLDNAAPTAIIRGATNDPLAAPYAWISFRSTSAVPIGQYRFEVEYEVDTETYINNKLAELSAAILNS